MDTGRILSWKGWNKCSSTFPLFSVSFSIQQTIFSVLHHFVNINESMYPNLPFLGRWENSCKSSPRSHEASLWQLCSPLHLPAQFRLSGVNGAQWHGKQHIQPPFNLQMLLFLSLTWERVWLQPRACTCTAGSVRSCSSHFITTPVDWLKPGENFYSSPLASQWAKAAKLYLSSWPTDPHFPGSCSPTWGGQQAATPSAWCERLRSASVAGNAGCWLLAWYKIQGTIKPIESN